MTRILIVAETAGDSISAGTLELISAARSFGRGVDIVALPVCGAGAALGELARYATVWTLERLSPHYEPSFAAAALRASIRELSPDLVLMSYSLAGMELGPIAANAIGGVCVTGVKAAQMTNGSVRCEVDLYDGKLVGRTLVSLPASLTILTGSYPPASPLDGVTEMKAAAQPAPDVVMKVTPVPVRAGSLDLTTSRRILSVGRGIGAKEKIEVFADLARLLDAEIAGSRPVIDNGWLPKERQVGKSGQSVRPDLYLSFGISGAMEHLEGIVGAEYVVAVNTDETAPIFRRANLCIACDVFEFADALSDVLRKRNG